MQTKVVVSFVTTVLLPIAAFAQTSPAPSAPPPSPPLPREPWEREIKLPKVPVTFLGVETSDVPKVVSEQLGLTKGFGLVVDYVVPDSPAATAGVQQNDIIKMLNDQILTEPDQLAKLVRSYSEGTTVTLTLLRKGKEEKVSVKLTKKEVPQRPEFGPGHHHRHSGFPFDQHDFGDLGMTGLREQMQELKERIGDEQRGMIHDAVMKARQEVMRAREQIRRKGDQIRIWSKDQDAIKSTKIDIGKAQIVFSDDQGELRVEKLNGKKVLTAKAPHGLLLFSGPVETKEDLDKVPADVRQRYEKLQQRDLPALSSFGNADEENGAIEIDEEPEGEVQSADQV
jgi:membrane-associated protease RseP (regulator of RpoE activity)